MLKFLLVAVIIATDIARAASKYPYYPYVNTYTNRTDRNQHIDPVYSPARPPSVPLAVRSPYTSAWSSTSGNNTLNSNGVTFWSGEQLGWEGIVQVDGVSYEWLGMGSQTLPKLRNFQTAIPLTVSYDSQYSNFTFAAGPIILSANFFSPVVPTDYCRSSIPLSYLTVSTKSGDGAAHDVQLYTDIDGAWASHNPAAPLTWDIYLGGYAVNGSNVTSASPSSIYSWVISLQHQYEFGESSQFPQWGNFTFSTAQGNAQELRFSSGQDLELRYNFIDGNPLNNIDDGDYRGRKTRTPVFAYSHSLGQVDDSGSIEVLYTLGSVQQPAVRYLTSAGLTSLRPWWTQCGYGDLMGLIDYHFNDITQSQVLGARYEAALKQAVMNHYIKEDPTTIYSKAGISEPPLYWNGTNEHYISGIDQFGQAYIFDSATAYGFLEPNHTCYAEGIAIPDVSEAESYYSIVALAARQIMGAYVLTTNPENASQPLAFQKEISSNGNVNTVDVMYPAMPFFVYSNPELLRFNLDPLFQYQEAGFYPNSYSMHDLGTHYPNATGHVEGNDEYMPVEESGNMIIMSLAYFKFSNDLSYLQKHYNILKRWASYLVQYSLVPARQLSTDDFAGELANQTNLAIKGIVGLQAMGLISTLVGDSVSAANYTQIAAKYYDQWTVLAIDPSERHTVLAYQDRSSWGLLYNTYPDKLLNLGIIPQSLYDMQSAWYRTVSQIFGVPLDSRHDYTKSDWEMWTAATCETRTRRLFVDSLAYWLNNTAANVPFSDLFGTTGNGSYPQSPDEILFEARPVQGGLYSLLALDTPQYGPNGTFNSTF